MHTYRFVFVVVHLVLPYRFTYSSRPNLLAHDEHVGTPQVLVGRLAVERAFQKRRHPRRHGVSIEVARFRLLEMRAPDTHREREISKNKNKNEFLARFRVPPPPIRQV